MLISCCDYSLVMRAVPLANLLSISGELRQRALKVFLALIEIKTTESFLKTKGRPIPCLLKEIERLTGLSKRSLRESLRHLERYQLLSVTETVEFNLELLKGAETILTTVSKNRHYKRIIPIPRQLLRRLSKSGAKTTILSALTLLIRGASYSGKGELKNRCAIKQSMIAQLLGVSVRSVINAFKILRSLGLIATETPRFIGKLIKDGLFVIITFSQKQSRPMKAAPASQKVESGADIRDTIKRSLKSVVEPDAVASKLSTRGQSSTALFFQGSSSNSASFFQDYRDKKLSSTKKDQISETISPVEIQPEIELDIFNLDADIFNKKLPGSWLVDLFIDGVKKGLFSVSEANFLNFFRARQRALTKGNCPTRLFSYLIRNGFCGITYHDEEVVDGPAKSLWHKYQPIMRQLSEGC